jgi:hypothetical protein
MIEHKTFHLLDLANSPQIVLALEKMIILAIEFDWSLKNCFYKIYETATEQTNVIGDVIENYSKRSSITSSGGASGGCCSDFYRLSCS